jgi:predicted amidophosphoribosyltransferase
MGGNQMGRFCAVCFNAFSHLHSGPQYFCLPCYEGFSPSSLHLPHGSSIFRYQGAIRSLILRAKVHGDLYALSALRSLFLASPALAEACEKTRYIVPMPSSLWGRLRGRIDIAWILADDTAKKFGRFLRPAPWHLHWRIKKRALSHTRARQELSLFQGEYLRAMRPGDDEGSEDNNAVPSLLIDDIVTTGFTLTQVASQLKNVSCSFFTLAEAYHQNQ